MYNLPKINKSALLASCLAATLIPQLAIAGHSSVFYDMSNPNMSVVGGFSVASPYTLATTANSSMGVSHGLTGNYLGPLGATSLSWFGLDNQPGKVDISFDLVLRGVWASNTFSLDFSSQSSDYFGSHQSPIDHLLSIAFNSPGNTSLPMGVTKLYEDNSGTFESAYRIKTTTQAIYGFGGGSNSNGSAWSLVFTGSPNTAYGPGYNGTWGIDNLDIRWGAAASVPEPGSALFLMAALPLIAATVYRRRRQSDMMA